MVRDLGIAEPAVPGPEEGDLELAQRSTAGDVAAQRQLFRAHRSRVQRTLFRILGSNQDMEDLVQDVFLEVFRSLHQFRGEAKLSTWIARITARVATGTFGRRKPAADSLDSVQLEAAGPSAEEVANLREAARHLYAALDRIDPVHRIAFALHAIDGLPLKEVAEITESSLVATKSRVWRARRDLEKRARRDPVLARFLGAPEVPS